MLRLSCSHHHAHTILAHTYHTYVHMSIHHVHTTCSCMLMHAHACSYIQCVSRDLFVGERYDIMMAYEYVSKDASSVCIVCSAGRNQQAKQPHVYPQQHHQSVYTAVASRLFIRLFRLASYRYTYTYIAGRVYPVACLFVLSFRHISAPQNSMLADQRSHD